MVVNSKYRLNNNTRRVTPAGFSTMPRKISSSELWNLDFTIVKFVIPRLKAFRNSLSGYPGDLTIEIWERYLDRMIEGGEIYIKEDGWVHPKMIGVKNAAKVRRAQKLFVEYFTYLWN